MSRLMKDAVREDWDMACDGGTYHHMANWAIKWGNPLMDALDRRVLNGELIEALEAALEWIDTVPSDTQLPTMPGFDRDEVNILLDKVKT